MVYSYSQPSNPKQQFILYYSIDYHRPLYMKHKLKLIRLEITAPAHKVYMQRKLQISICSRPTPAT